MSKRKKIARLSVLLGLVLVVLVGFILRFSIEPTNYRGPLRSAADAAQTLAQSVVTGNENGQYSANTVARFHKQIDAARGLAENEQSRVSEQKQALKSLKEETEQFKKAANQQSLSAAEFEQIKQKQSIFTKTVTISDSATAEWEIDLNLMQQPQAVNFEIGADSVNQEEIDRQLREEGAEGFLLSLRHNGTLPVSAIIRYADSSVNTDSHLYRYDEQTQQLIYDSDVAVINGCAVLVVDRGGDWVISDQLLSAESGDSPSSESGEETQSIDSSSESDSSSEASSSSSASQNSESAPASSANPSAPSSQASGGLQNTGGGESGGTGVDPGNSGPAGEAEQQSTCTLEIRCNTILNNMSSLKEGKADYVPADGVIFPRQTVVFKEGESVFSVLSRIAYDNNIHMSYRMDPLYSGAYVEEIGHLREYDCGGDSGWMFMLNGSFPGYGVSNYKVKVGDVIQFIYTCDNGKDVGDPYYD